MAPHVPFRGFRTDVPNCWTYFDCFWIHGFSKLKLEKSTQTNLDGQMFRPDVRGVRPDLAKAESVTVLEGVTDRTRIVVDLEARFVKVWVSTWRNRTRLPAKLPDAHRRLSIAFSYHIGSTFHKAFLNTLPEPKPEKLESDYGTFWQWEIRHFDSDMQKFVQAFQFCETMQVTVAVTGEAGEPKERALVNGWPTIDSMDRTLESMALVVASPSSAFVKLLVSDEDAKYVKVHRELLEKASPYFRALLSGGFAESSALAASSPQKRAATTSKTSADMPAGTPSPRRGRKRQKKSQVDSADVREQIRLTETLLLEESLTSNGVQCDVEPLDEDSIPVVRMSDTTFEELQVLTYHIYTGLAVFKQRNNTSQTIDQVSRSDPPWKKGTFPAIDAMDMYRVADRYDFDALRAAALCHISSEISVASLTEDLKSCDALHVFPPLKRLYLEFCMKHQSELSSTSNYDDIMNYFVSGP